jgi:hypothetical protein
LKAYTKDFLEVFVKGIKKRKRNSEGRESREGGREGGRKGGKESPQGGRVKALKV